MMRLMTRWTTALTLVLMSGVGCQLFNKKQSSPPPPPPPPPSTGVPYFQGSASGAPAPTFPPVPQTAPPPGNVQFPNEIRRYEPPLMATPPSWEPTRLSAPQGEQAAANGTPLQEPAPLEAQSPRTTSPEPAPVSRGLPAGIPQFAMVKDQVATGSRPLLDGLDWLKENGYKTVLHVHRPGEGEATDRRQVEKRGLKYRSLQISPETLSKQSVNDFNQIVGDRDARPLFVYDRDGLLTGAIWYLHFRTAGHQSDQEARINAFPLGLKEDHTEDGKNLWLAIQKLLEELKL